MKNTFRFLALAFVAGALMLTACKKDNDDPTPGTTVAVNFDGAQLPNGYTNAMSVATDSKSVEYDFYMMTAKNGKINGQEIELTLPYTEMQFDNANRDFDDIWKMKHGDKWGIDALDLCKDQEGYTIEGKDYGEWTIDGDLIAYDVTEFDATTMNISYSTTASMASMKEYMEDETESIRLSECTHKNITVNVSNLNFPVLAKKAALTKKIVK